MKYGKFVNILRAMKNPKFKQFEHIPQFLHVIYTLTITRGELVAPSMRVESVSGAQPGAKAEAEFSDEG